MIRLIKSNFYSISKSRYFYVLMLVSAVIGAGLTVGIYYFPEINIPDNAALDIKELNVLSIIPNLAGIAIPFISAAAAGLFLETEYTQGTIRNKMICGNKRSIVFFSQLITVCLLTVLYFTIYEITVFSIAVFAFDFSDITLKAAASSLGALLLMIIAAGTALSFMIGSLVHGGKLIVILLAIQYAMNVFLVFGIYKENSRIFDCLSRVVPQGMMFTLTYDIVPDKLVISYIASLIMAAAFICAGFAGFRKSDIK